MKNRVYLRAFKNDDFLISYKWRNNYEVTNGLICRKLFISEENEKKWIEDANSDKVKNVKLAICLIDNDEYIGNVYLTEIDHINKKAGLGIFIGEENHHKKGYATEAIKLILDHAFIDLGLERIESKQFTNYIASIRLHDSLGFYKEGVLRKYFFKNGKYNDVSVMSILKKEYLTINDIK
ncbi:TPA: GNAT family N-acetyltransferase [Photobacterium damselae]